jgi:plastocyanin
VIALGSACGGGGDGGTGNEDPVFTSLNVSPTTLSVAVGATSAPLAVSPRDQDGRAMTGLPAATFSSSNQGRATVSGSGAVTGVSAGTATITASVTHGGITRTGSSAITVTAAEGPAPTTANVSATVNSTFNPDSVRIATGGTVTWNFSSLDHNVVFNNVAGKPADIGTTVNESVPRTFGTAGTFPYRCTIHPGMDGKVLVQTP